MLFSYVLIKACLIVLVWMAEECLILLPHIQFPALGTMPCGFSAANFAVSLVGPLGVVAMLVFSLSFGWRKA